MIPDLQAELARRLGVSHQALSAWREVPASRLVEVEHITKLRREWLRPDLFLAPRP